MLLCNDVLLMFLPDHSVEYKKNKMGYQMPRKPFQRDYLHIYVFCKFDRVVNV